ncbi:hypothetical protein [Sulfuriflexus mobilis]|uniref:hypothetical protein n=1 Tax=Sulfuriflexus mobilis TaxID=1811807 RepID=UPI000F825D7C|nr:hypothetical protein [Sulfuriflexus mobilis]
MKKSTPRVIAYAAALSISLGLSTPCGAEPDVQEIETPPPAVRGSTETKKIPGEWELQKSTQTPSQKERYPEPPPPKIDRSGECHPSHGTRTREALGCD